jgi:predicted PurR-regulated permease PerM
LVFWALSHVLVVAVEVLAGLVLTLVLAVHLVHSGDRLARSLTKLLPPRQRDRAREAATTTWNVLGAPTSAGPRLSCWSTP